MQWVLEHFIDDSFDEESALVQYNRAYGSIDWGSDDEEIEEDEEARTERVAKEIRDEQLRVRECIAEVILGRKEKAKLEKL